MVCHLRRQVGDFAACCLHILFSINLLSVDFAVVCRDYDVRLRFYVIGIEIGRKGTVCVFVIEFKSIEF